MSRSRHYCSVDGCTNQRRNELLTFFKLPANDDRREKWLQLIGRRDLLERPDLNHNSHYVCSVHFENTAITIVKKLHPDALPTKFLPDQPQSSYYDSEIDSNFADKSTQTKKLYVETFFVRSVQDGTDAASDDDDAREASGPQNEARPSSPCVTSWDEPKKIKLRPTLIEPHKKKKRKVEREPMKREWE